LQEAVNAEEYERAAVIRDKIKELEQNQIGS
jgi:protein-arginine kinase activator protein McsA